VKKKHIMYTKIPRQQQGKHKYYFEFRDNEATRKKGGYVKSAVIAGNTQQSAKNKIKRFGVFIKDIKKIQ